MLMVICSSVTFPIIALLGQDRVDFDVWWVVRVPTDQQRINYHNHMV